MGPAHTTIAQCRCGASPAPGMHAVDRRGAEVVGWHEIHSLVDSLTAEELLKPGYHPEGWTVRDLMAHLSSWLAEGGKQLEQIHAGTYRAGELDVEAANREFSELTMGIPFEVVYVQAWASRWRMLGVWRDLTEVTAPAAGWLDKVGAEHYDEHLPHLREWVEELVGNRIVAR